jgi:AsmA-like C-terminal region
MAWYKEGGWFHRSKDHIVVRSTGRAIHHTSKAVHWLLALGTGLLVVASCLLAGAAWRLAQGPIDLGGWSDRLRSALIDDDAPIRVSFDGVFLAWEGFSKGVDYPLDLRLSGVTITDSAGRRLIAAPGAHLTFSLAGLLLGRVVPRAIEVDHAQIAVTREAGGTIDLGGDLASVGATDSGNIDLRQIQEQLSRPASGDHGRTRGLFDQLRRTHFRGTEVTLRDQESGLVIRTQDMDLDLVRARSGRIRGMLRAPLSIGNQQASLAAQADWAAGSKAMLDMKLTALRPAGVGAIPPALAFLAGIDAPVALATTIGFDPDFKPNQMRADIQVGQGQILVGQGSVPVRSAAIALSGRPGEITISRGRFDVAHTPEGSPELVDIGGTVTHSADRVSASLTLGLSQIDVADLPRLWPPGIARGSRPWVIENVTAGMATRGTASFVIEADDALHDVVLTNATGDLDGSNGTFTWIDNVPAVEQTDFHLHLVDPDTLDIRVSSAHQRIRNGAPDLLIRDGQMHITGLALHDQTAVIRTRVEGPVASALSLLKEPRLHLLSTHPIALKTGGGDAAATLDFQFPLENKLQIDDVRIHADAHLTKVRLLDVVAGQGLDDGVFDVAADKDGLSLKGQGTVAAVPIAVDGTMDFNPGPPDQVVQKIAMTGQPDSAQLDAAGLHVADFLGGPVPLTVVMVERRNGNGSVAINGDLTLATLALNPLAWNKPSGNVANASATLLMSHDRLTKIDRISVRGDGLLLTGSADLPDGHIRTLVLDSISLGRTKGHGTVHLGANEPIAVVLQGDQIDLSSKLTEKMSVPDKLGTTDVTTPDWTLDARFDRAILANGERAGDLLVKAAGGGQTIRLLDAVGTTQSSAGFSIKIEPHASKRRLLVDAKDAGSFLRSLDAIRGMQSGHLTIDGTFDSPYGLHPLSGTATIDNVVVKNSPVLGKLLQAITLYGLVDVLRGPGMTFSHIVVPFHYDGADLRVDEAHAYNSSLGLTGNGRIGLSSGQLSLTGTIVPAYFFNSMLGNLPLVGKLFSPEKGGGVFAARFGVDGQTDDPSISINPVSALTPGFLREIFGIFDRAPTGKGGVPTAGSR